MKNTRNIQHASAHPNAAGRQYRIDKAIDTALTAAATVGLTITLLFLLLI